MRLTILLLCFAVLSTLASEGYSQATKLTVVLENTSIENVLKEIENQSEFRFFYNGKIDVDKQVSVNFTNKNIFEILDNILEKTEISYEVIGRQVVLSPEGNSFVFQQKKEVKGKVTNTLGEPLPGVTIVIKGTTQGSISDVDGNYLISQVPSNATLVYSFVGMKTVEVPVNGQGTIDVEMEDETIGLEEVVAIGYGTTRRKDLTGSVASVSGTALKDIPVTSAAQAIVGRMPGVQVTQTEGSPDAEIKIRIRGGGSITQDNSPLYIVDGFPVNDINDIAPTDIASIDVLKDASSTAIYGARGANGVIIVTTKSGSEGKGKVSYNSYFGIRNITKTLDVLDPYEYAYWQYEVQKGQANAEYLGDFMDYNLYKQIDGTNWQDRLFGRTGTSMEHNLSISGGTEKNKYNISLTRNDEKAIMIGSGYDRTNLTIKTSHNVNKWLTIDLNTRLSDYSVKGAGTSSGSRLSHVIQFRPMEGLSQYVDADLSDADFDIASQYVLNPILQTNDDYRRRNRLSFNFSGAVGIKFSPCLSYRLEVGVEYRNDINKRFYGLNTSDALRYGLQPLASISKTESKRYHIANILTYSKKLSSDIKLNVMLGEELNSLTLENLTSSAKYFPTYISAVSALSMMSLGFADPIVTLDAPDVKTTSFFGRVNFDLKSKYIVSATLRADGSSKFAPGNQWGYFPSAGFAWRMSEESFMESTESWLSNFKWRLSYGQSGNNRIADDAWKKTYSVGTGGIFLDGNEESPTAFLVPGSVLSNPRLKWETTVTRNVGLDFGFFNNRLAGSVEAYKNTTRDLLVSVTIPSSTGYKSQLQNIGQTSNKGIELTLNGVLVEKRDFRLSASFNIGFNKNHIDKLGENKQWGVSSNWMSGGDGPGNDFLVEEGKSVGLMYGYVTDGMYSFDDFNYDETTGIYSFKEGVVNSADATIAPIMPGTLKLKDLNDDQIITDDDKTVIGNANPKHTGGFNLMANYKGFDFSAFFNWVYGNDIYNANKVMFTSAISGRPWKNLLNIMNSEDRYIYWDQMTGEYVTDPEQLAQMNQGKTIWSADIHKGVFHSWAVEDGSFLRLNNLTVGYTLPKELLRKLHIDQLRIYATGYNLWIWTNYSGYDPEVDTRRSTPLTPGVDWNAYPRSRTYTMGLNLTF